MENAKGYFKLVDDIVVTDEIYLSGKTVTVDFQAPARDSSDEKPGDGKNDVIASGKVNNNPKSGVLGNTGSAISIVALAIAMLAAIAMIVKTTKISR